MLFILFTLYVYRFICLSIGVWIIQNEFGKHLFDDDA